MPNPVLVNTLGHAAGLIVFGILLGLLLRRPSGRLPVVATGLALAWNLASLAMLGPLDPSSPIARACAAAGFSVASILPAVLFDIASAGDRRWLVRTGYALAGAATMLHVSEAVRPNGAIHHLGVQVITVGFGVLTLAALVKAQRRTQIVASMALFLFAVSFLHFGEGAMHSVWSHELILHHAGIPLALFVLLQDYRFVMLDAFGRFVANAILAALFVAVGALVLAQGARWPSDPFGQGLALVACCLALALFAATRGAVQRLLTRAVFGQPDLDAAARGLRELGDRAADEASYLDAALDRVQLCFDAEWARWSDTAPAGASMPVRVDLTTVRYGEMGPRRGGRRYLSEDIDALARLGAEIALRLEESRKAEAQRLAAEAELRALQAQIHPHFLFNALNTLLGIIPKEAAAARRTVHDLSDLLRYFLRTDRRLAPLGEEIRIVESYLSIEQLRLGDRLSVKVSVEPGLENIPVPLLSIEPLVENAVKHGIARSSAGGWVRVTVGREDGGLRVAVEDSGGEFLPGGSGSVGLDNVRRRLDLHYGSESTVDAGVVDGVTRVSFRIPMAVGAMR